jgi:hypothetical protein
MKVTIQIHYKANDIGILQRGTFPLKNRQPKEVAFQWWKQIKKEIPIDNLEKVLCNGEDITEIIQGMEQEIE